VLTNTDSFHRLPSDGVAWARVIVDEAHKALLNETPENRAGKLHALTGPSMRRWAVTGTPYVNGAQNLLSLFKFLRYSPYDNKASLYGIFEKKDATVPLVLAGKEDAARACLAPIALRRTKEALAAAAAKDAEETMTAVPEDGAAGGGASVSRLRLPIAWKYRFPIE
jgi:SNF2 family DNA or RNA helicase